MKTLWIFGHQLPAASHFLETARRESPVLMIESKARGKLYRYHKKLIRT